MTDTRTLITTIFQNFTVDSKAVPVQFMRYTGHETTYVTWMQYDMDNSFSGDNEILGYVEYYDFDIYSSGKDPNFKGNYTNIIKQIKALLKENGFEFQPSRCSADMFETDTGYYHKTLSFAIYFEEE